MNIRCITKAKQYIQSLLSKQGRLSFEPPLSHKAIQRLDEKTPKHDNWWAFPVCAYSSLFNDNSRALFEFIKNKRSIKKIILTREHDIAVSGKNIVVAPLNSKTGLHYLLRSRFIFVKHGEAVNIGLPVSPELHAIINLWHGIPLKRIGYVSHDLRGQLQKIAQGNAKLQSVICASDVDRLAMAAAFWPLTYHDIWLTGLPRHDCITCEADTLPGYLREQSERLVAMLSGRGLILFAPTFKNDQSEGYYHFTPDELHALNDFLTSRNLVLGVREHMADRSHSYASRLCGSGCITLSADLFPDIEVLYRHAIMLVTDYSSAFIDFLLTGRPVVSFAYDLEQYRSKERGLFYDMEWAFPGIIAKNFDELMAALAASLREMDATQRASYEFKRKIFIKHMDGKNAQRVYKRVLRLYKKS